MKRTRTRTASCSSARARSSPMGQPPRSRTWRRGASSARRCRTPTSRRAAPADAHVGPRSGDLVQEPRGRLRRAHCRRGRRQRSSPMSATVQASPAMADASERQVPPFGGFNLTALKLEVRRVLRNRRTVMFILVFPSVFFFMFGATARGGQSKAGPGAVAYIMISMAVYGAMVGTTAGGAAVAVERSLGWSRQLRLTPLRPGAYVAMKVLTAMTLGLIAIVTEFAVGAASGVHMSAES